MVNQEIEDFTAKVAEIINPYTVVINRGSTHGIYKGQKFLIYGASDKKIMDPDTGDVLGSLSIPKGEGVAVRVDELITVITSIDKEPPKAPGQLRSLASFVGVEAAPGEIKPFINIEKGDKAKPADKTN